MYGMNVGDLINWLEEHFDVDDTVHIEVDSLCGHSTLLDKECAVEVNTVADVDDGDDEEF